MCAPSNTDSVSELIRESLNEDVTFASKPLDMRNQRTYAVKVCFSPPSSISTVLGLTKQSGVNGLLDVARTTYKETNQDAFQLMTDLAG